MMYPNETILHPDNGPSGFVTNDFQFAAIPFGNQYMIIAQGQQLEVVKTRALAEIRLEQLKNSHRKLKKGTRTLPPAKSQKKQKKTPLSSGVRGSKTPTGGGVKKTPSKPKPTKTKPVSKPSILNSNPLLDALH
jgi:hypothetical protein